MDYDQKANLPYPSWECEEIPVSGKTRHHVINPRDIAWCRYCKSYCICWVRSPNGKLYPAEAAANDKGMVIVDAFNIHNCKGKEVEEEKQAAELPQYKFDKRRSARTKDGVALLGRWNRENESSYRTRTTYSGD